MFTFKFRVNLAVLLVLVLIMLSFAGMAYAQEEPEIPPAFEEIFAQQFLMLVAAVISTTKLVRNALGGLKGTVAVVATFFISEAVALVQFGLFGAEGYLKAALIGLVAFAASAGIFKGTKLFGKKVNDVKALRG